MLKVKLVNRVTIYDLPYYLPLETVLKVVKENEENYLVDDGLTEFYVHKKDVVKVIKGG